MTRLELNPYENMSATYILQFPGLSNSSPLTRVEESLHF